MVTKISEIQIAKFNNKAATIGLIGLGYAGFPLAFTFAKGLETVVWTSTPIRPID